MEKKFPRVLLISHNALSQTKNNGKTLASFFSGWDKDALAQLYITEELPDTTICDRFFRITDREILKAVLGKEKCPGSVVQEKQLQQETAQPDAGQQGFLQKLIARRPQWLLVGRDLCWGSGLWKTPQLEAWLDDYAPEAVFMQCSAPAIYDIAFWVCDRYKIPYFLEITDDYTSSKFSVDPFFWIYLKRMQRQMAKAISRAKKTLVIGEKMEKEYAKRFGGSYYIAMNSVEVDPYQLPTHRECMKIVFTGNLGLGRWETIEMLGKACNADPVLKKRVCIDIYSASVLSDEETVRLNQGVMQFKGRISAEEVAAVQKNADILLHVESFSPENRYITRYSISTKIPEYLSRGRCILAIGPEDVASVEYIRDYQLGAVLTERSELAMRNCLVELLQDDAMRQSYGMRAYGRACTHHNIEIVQRDVKEMLDV